VEIEILGYMKTKDNRDKTHEMHSRIEFIRPQKNFRSIKKH